MPCVVMIIIWFILEVFMLRVCRRLLPRRSTLPLAVTFLVHNLVTMAAYQTSPALKAEKAALRKKMQGTLNELDDGYLSQQVGYLFFAHVKRLILMTSPSFPAEPTVNLFSASPTIPFPLPLSLRTE